MKQTWTATTIAEAINLLDAATKQLEAQALALEPGGFHERKEAERATPVHLAIEFDLTELTRRIADKHQARALNG
ncbi:hypothetical protein GTY67_13525 [Streptomyces sp. SID8374]|uniref:hypothetical protein n=1 Tax=Streptomyces sp. SID8374 TaxID=2690354 RepID=UPI001369A4CF|nr:hypothetical protein [Streptomyces sp. SID8374]MYX14417.1 hypothetical protein [Streptomyces sp. SID8374]